MSLSSEFPSFLSWDWTVGQGFRNLGKQCSYKRVLAHLLAADEVFSRSDLRCDQREWRHAGAGERSTESGSLWLLTLASPVGSFVSAETLILVWTQVFTRVCQMTANGFHTQRLHCGEPTVCQVPCHVPCGAKHASYFCDHFQFSCFVSEETEAE